MDVRADITINKLNGDHIFSKGRRQDSSFKVVENKRKCKIKHHDFC